MPTWDARTRKPLLKKGRDIEQVKAIVPKRDDVTPKQYIVNAMHDGIEMGSNFFF
jgi:hypothetical protein